MNCLRPFYLCVCLVVSAPAQTLRTSSPPKQPPPEYRVVTNHVFNVPLSIYWQPFKGECLRFLTNGIIVQEVEVMRIYEPRTVNPLERIGAFGAPMERRLLSEDKIRGKKFLLKNYPSSLQATTGKEIRGKAMRTGTILIGGDVLEVWDYGTPISNSPLQKKP